MIKVLIVEDEIPAQINLKKLIDKCCPDSRIVMTLTSVNSTVKWLEENPEAANTFMTDYAASVAFVNENTAEAAQMIGEINIVPAAVAETSHTPAGIGREEHGQEYIS